MRKIVCFVLVFTVVQLGVPFAHSQTPPTITRAIGDWNTLLTDIELTSFSGVVENLTSQLFVGQNLIQIFTTSDGIDLEITTSATEEGFSVRIEGDEHVFSMEAETSGAKDGAVHVKINFAFNAETLNVNVLLPVPGDASGMKVLVEPEKHLAEFLSGVGSSQWGQTSLLRLQQFVLALPPTPTTAALQVLLASMPLGARLQEMGFGCVPPPIH